jgi:hypothetical protein
VAHRQQRFDLLEGGHDAEAGEVFHAPEGDELVSAAADQQAPLLESI